MTIYSDTLHWSDITSILDFVTELDHITEFDLRITNDTFTKMVTPFLIGFVSVTAELYSCEGFNLNVIIHASLLVFPMLGCRHSFCCIAIFHVFRK